MRGSTDCAGMGDERGDDADQRRADVYSSARIGAAAALTIVLVVLLVLDVAVPDYDISPGHPPAPPRRDPRAPGPRGLSGLVGREVKTVTALLTNKAYGYPTRGARRRRKPTILACLHQTANAKATAMQERNYANRPGSWGPSATAYIDRDGTIVRAIDPVKYAAWSQGDVAHPNTKLPTIAAAVASGVNMNEWVHESIECSGTGTEPYTDAQFESVARLVAAAAHAVDVGVDDHSAAVDGDAQRLRCRGDELRRALELSVREGFGPDTAALDRLVHPLVRVHARRHGRDDRRDLPVGLGDVALAPGGVLHRIERPNDRAVAIDVRRGGWPRGPCSVGVVALLHRRRLGVGRLVQAGEDRRLPSPPCAAGGIAVGLVGEECRDRLHLRLRQKAEASSPRSAQIAPRSGKRMPGLMS